MLNKYVAKLAIFLIRNKRFEGEVKTQIITALLDNIQALPFRNMITFREDGTIYVNNKKITTDQGIALRESALAMKDSFARTVIKEQVKFNAVKLGINECITPEQMMFAKAALWYGEQEDLLISTLGNV